jgi:hypothetical protein
MSNQNNQSCQQRRQDEQDQDREIFIDHIVASSIINDGVAISFKNYVVYQNR